MASNSAFAGLDRKAMEAERLARLARKRGAEDEQVSQISSTNVIRDYISRPPKKPKLASATSSLPPSVPSKGIQYPHGVIKKTWAYGYDRKNDIKIEEVLQKSTLKTAVISTFTLDFDWLVTKLDLTKSKLLLIMHERNDKRREEWKRDASQRSKSLRLCFPPLVGPYDCMHSKLMLLFHPEHLRIVIPSANIVPFDWGETGIMENSVFCIDLPRLQDHSASKNGVPPTPFAEELHRFLSAQGLDSDVLNGLTNFDFSNTQHLAFIHTMRGFQFAENIDTTGFPGFAKAIRRLDLGVSTDEALEVDCTASSVGSLTEDQLETMYRSFRGQPPLLPSASATKKASQDRDKLNLSESLRIYFPSQDTVKRSRGGPENGGTIFLQPQYWAKDSFPRHVFRDSLSRRSGLLSHCKIILGRSPSSAWVYVGSANLSQNAWGRLVWDKTTKSPKLSAGNWECGVLMSVPQMSEDDISTASEGEQTETTGSKVRNGGPPSVIPFEKYAEILDVPFQWPGPAYRSDQKPWSAGTAAE